MTADEYLEALRAQSKIQEESVERPSVRLFREFRQQPNVRSFLDAITENYKRDRRRQFAEHYGLSQDYVESAPHISPEEYWRKRMLELAGKIKAVAANKSIPLLDQPVHVGTLPLGALNARVLDVPGSTEKLIVFNDGLFTFVNLFIKIMLTCLVAYEGSAGEEQSKLFQKAHLRLHDLLLAYVLGGRPEKASPWLLPANLMILHRHMLESCEPFIFAHELSHAAGLQPTLQQPLRRRADGRTPEFDLEALTQLWLHELRADYAAVMITVAALKDYGPLSRTCAGIEAYFMGAELIERALSILRVGPGATDPPGTHPPPKERSIRLRQQFVRDCGGDGTRVMYREADKLQAFAEVLWGLEEPFFLEKWQKGAKPAPLWNALA
jgi:hypothetical protein